MSRMDDKCETKTKNVLKLARFQTAGKKTHIAPQKNLLMEN